MRGKRRPSGSPGMIMPIDAMSELASVALALDEEAGLIALLPSFLRERGLALVRLEYTERAARDGASYLRAREFGRRCEAAVRARVGVLVTEPGAGTTDGFAPSQGATVIPFPGKAAKP